MNKSTLMSHIAEENHLATPSALPFMQFVGINPLVAAAQPLLLLMIALKQTRNMEPHKVMNLRRSLMDEVSSFANSAHNQHCSPRLILAARYCLCTALDEVVLSTAWGSEGVWSRQTLLSIIQKETWGGERFFIILEEMAKAPKENLPLLELLYIILSLGFEGRHYSQEQSVRDEIKHRLFHLIMLHRPEPDKWLSPSLNILQQPRVRVEPLFSKWKIVWLTLMLLLGLSIIFNMATYFVGRNTLKEFMAISQEIEKKSL